MTTPFNVPRPWWFALIVLITIIPAFSFPTLLQTQAAALGYNRILIWFYPIAIIAYAILAWATYPTRRLLSWLLLAMSALTTLAILLLTAP